ncbi:hypothetical protein ACA910_018182 [Epithemia clementina (nom. ined.)]
MTGQFVPPGLACSLQPSLTNTNASARYFSSGLYESPLDDLLDPDSPCPIYGTRKDSPLKRFPKKYLECGLCEDALRFKTVYYGKMITLPGIHANEHRVTMMVDIKDLPLDDLGKQILQQLVGINRYNVHSGKVKMSAVVFASRIENKRYIVRMFDKLVLACQRLSKSLPNGNSEQAKNDVVEAAKELIAGETAEAS